MSNRSVSYHFDDFIQKIVQFDEISIYGGNLTNRWFVNENFHTIFIFRIFVKLIIEVD